MTHMPQSRQAQRIDTEFDDHHFREGAYPTTHAGHMQRWHDQEEHPV